MIRSVNPYAINAYFNPDEAQSFFIPKYQREYVWRKENWEALCDDLEDAVPGYFLGSIICVNAQADSLQGNRLELIDGQQRFMTICLLFCALYQALRKIPNPDENLVIEMANLKRRLFVKGTRDWRFIPTEQSKNKDDFQYILNQNFPDMASPPRELSYFGVRRLSKAYSYLRPSERTWPHWHHWVLGKTEERDPREDRGAEPRRCVRSVRDNQQPRHTALGH